jgi:two-component system response regulator HydG
MAQILRETNLIDVRCYRADAGAIGSSPAWQGVLAAAVRVAATEATVFLQGESGTGKEVIARLIHQASPRRPGPFVAVNCAALPEQLLESELFGYERGAFTSAQQSKAGHIELAARGSPPSDLSVVERGTIKRVLEETGGNKSRAARRLGLTRTQLYGRLKRYGLEAESADVALA